MREYYPFNCTEEGMLKFSYLHSSGEQQYGPLSPFAGRKIFGPSARLNGAVSRSF